MERSVTGLNSEQLYRKRALDRVNQRASRARKKSRIQELEDEVLDLQQRLARSEDRVRRLQDSDACLRDIIESAQVSLQMVEHHTKSPSNESRGPETDSRVTSPSREPMVQFDQLDSEAYQLQLSPTRMSDKADSRDGIATVGTQGGASLGRSTEGLTLRDSCTGLSLDLPCASNDDMLEMWDEACKHIEWLQDPSLMSLAFDLNACSVFSLGILDGGVAGNIQHVQDEWSASVDTSVAEVSGTSPSSPVWGRLPLHVEARCQLDSVLLGLIESSRQHLQDSGELPDTSFPSIKSLLNPAARDVQNPISNALGQHGKVSMAISGTPERVACLYYLSLLVRWLIAPTRRHFEAMPQFLRPIDEQIQKPHPIWIDTIVWYADTRASNIERLTKLVGPKHARGFSTEWTGPSSIGYA